MRVRGKICLIEKMDVQEFVSLLKKSTIDIRFVGNFTIRFD